MKKFELFNLKKNEGGKHTLTALELKDYIDFDVKRIYFVKNPKVKEIAGHCHYEEKELFILVRGLVRALIDKGNGIEEIPMAEDTAIYVPNFVWHGFKYDSDDVIIAAVSSTNYKSDRSDYIEDYSEYLKIRDQKLNE